MNKQTLCLIFFAFVITPLTEAMEPQQKTIPAVKALLESLYYKTGFDPARFNEEYYRSIEQQLQEQGKSVNLFLNKHASIALRKHLTWETTPLLLAVYTGNNNLLKEWMGAGYTLDPTKKVRYKTYRLDSEGEKTIDQVAQESSNLWAATPHNNEAYCQQKFSDPDYIDMHQRVIDERKETIKLVAQIKERWQKGSQTK